MTADDFARSRGPYSRRQTNSSGSDNVDLQTQLQSEQPPTHATATESAFYEDPLVSYDPELLDNPLLPQLTNRRVFTFSGYMTSIIGYRRPNEHKRYINRDFQQRFPKIQLTLSKMRSIKHVLLSIALRMNLELWIVAHAYVLFEKMLLKHFVCKANRKNCAGAAMLISAKLNDIKGAMIPQLIQELENDFRVSRRDLLHMELVTFIGLEFSILPLITEAAPHFAQLNKSLGLVPASLPI